MKKSLSFFLALCIVLSALTFVSVSAENLLVLKSNSKLRLEEIDGFKIVTAISEQTTVATLAGNFKNSESITVSRGETLLKETDIVGTGDVVSMGDVSVNVVIKGDTTGDGKVTTTDYLQTKSHFLRVLTLEGLKFIAADTDDSRKLSTTDYLQIKSYFLDVFNLYPEITTIPEDDASEEPSEESKEPEESSEASSEASEESSEASSEASEESSEASSEASEESSEASSEASEESSEASSEASEESKEPEELVFNLENVSLVGTTVPEILIEGTYTGEGELFVKINGNDTVAVMDNGVFSIKADISSLNEKGRWYDIHVYYTNEKYVDIDAEAINYDANTELKIGSRTYKFASWNNQLKVYYESTENDPYEGIDPTIAGILKTCTFECKWVCDESGAHSNGGWYPLISFQGTIPEEYRGQIGFVSSLKVCFANNDKLDAAEVIAEEVSIDENYQINYSFDLTRLLEYGDSMKGEWFYIEIKAKVLFNEMTISMPLGLYSEEFVPESNAGDVCTIGEYELENGTKATFKFNYNTFDYKVLAVSYTY